MKIMDKYLIKIFENNCTFLIIDLKKNFYS